ncbi:MAG TPA: glycosyltransferase family 4 protein [Solirubrobacterales bacterium]|nr:glycosyltransferase family 4 protein [Solirubrobacterales bacterium]
MKILISTDTVGGVLTYTAELAAALEAEGDEVVVATMGPQLRREQRSRLPARVYESGLRLEWMADPWDEVAAAGRWLLALEEVEQPDVAHLCSYAHGALPFRAPKVLVAHSCVLSWWRAVHGTEAPAEWSRYREEMAAGLDGADAIVAPTEAMLLELERDHYLPPDTATVIHNGTPLRSMGRKYAYIEGNRPINLDELVLGSGRFWDPAKNLGALDAAAESLAWPVVVAGDLGPEGETRHAQSTGLLDPAELGELRRRASIYAAPAVYEPFGLGILEAARDGCALVLGGIPSLRELWGDAAAFVDPHDSLSLHEALAALIADERLRADLAQRAQGRAAAYSIQRTARAYRHLYEGLVRTGKEVYS